MNSDSSQPPNSFFAYRWTLRHFLTSRLSLGILILSVGLISVAYYFNVAMASPQAASPEAIDLLPVETTTVRYQKTYEIARNYTGQVVARRSSDLSFETNGKVIQLLVDQGDRVEAGQLLAQLDDRHLRARILQVTAQRAQQAAILNELLKGPRRETIDAAKAEVKQWKAELALQQANFERRKQLFLQNATSRENLENSQYGMEAAEGRLQGAQSRLKELEEGTRIEQVNAQKAVVAQLDAQLRDLQHEEEDTKLIAPYSGTISSRLVDEGTVTSTGSTIFKIVEDDHLEAWFGIPVQFAGRIRPGEQYQPLIANATHQATVQRILPELDSTTRSVTVVLAMNENSVGKLLPGQVARLPLSIDREGTGAWIPNSALMRGSRGLWSVYVVEDPNSASPKVVRRDVEILVSDSARSYVRGTIVDGDQVVTSGVNRIVPGNRVEIVTTDSSTQSPTTR